MSNISVGETVMVVETNDIPEWAVEYIGKVGKVLEKIQDIGQYFFCVEGIDIDHDGKRIYVSERALVKCSIDINPTTWEWINNELGWIPNKEENHEHYGKQTNMIEIASHIRKCDHIMVNGVSYMPHGMELEITDINDNQKYRITIKPEK